MRGGLRALAQRLGEREEQRQHRDQQRDLLVKVLAVVMAVATAMLVMLDLVLDLMLNRMHTVTHVASPSVDRANSSKPGSVSRPRMSAAIDFKQTIGVNSRIDLRRRERGVAEQFLDGAQIAAARQQMRRERMPKRMGRRRVRQAKRAAQPFHDKLHDARRQGSAARADEQRAVGRQVVGAQRDVVGDRAASTCGSSGTMRCLLPLPVTVMASPCPGAARRRASSAKRLGNTQARAVKSASTAASRAKIHGSRVLAGAQVGVGERFGGRDRQRLRQGLSAFSAPARRPARRPCLCHFSPKTARTSAFPPSPRISERPPMPSARRAAMNARTSCGVSFAKFGEIGAPPRCSAMNSEELPGVALVGFDGLWRTSGARP